MLASDPRSGRRDPQSRPGEATLRRAGTFVELLVPESRCWEYWSVDELPHRVPGGRGGPPGRRALERNAPKRLADYLYLWETTARKRVTLAPNADRAFLVRSLRFAGTSKPEPSCHWCPITTGRVSLPPHLSASVPSRGGGQRPYRCLARHCRPSEDDCGADSLVRAVTV
jgi:hypothetical protein